MDKVNFQNFMTLVGPPVLFQQRVKASNDCGTAFAAKWLKRAHEEAIHNRCSPPMECSDHVRSEVNSYMSCRGGPDEDAGFFGSTPLSFEDNVGFVDFLCAFEATGSVVRMVAVRPATCHIIMCTVHPDTLSGTRSSISKVPRFEQCEH